MAEQERKCLNGLSPDTPVRVPTDSEFEGRDRMRSRDLKNIGDAIIRAPRYGLGDLLTHEVQIEYLWVNKKKEKAGKTVWATCFKESGRARFYADCDYSIEVYAGSLRDYTLSHWQLQALIDHELRHIDLTIDDETGEVSFGVIGHDVEMFYSELKHYGLWDSSLKRAAVAFHQLTLSEDKTGTSSGDDEDEQPDRPSGTTITISTANESVTLTSEQFNDATRRLLGSNIDLDPDVTPHASGLIPDAITPEVQIERTLRASGIPVRYDPDDGLYRNPNGDAYASGWAEQEAGIQARSTGQFSGLTS